MCASVRARWQAVAASTLAVGFALTPLLGASTASATGTLTQSWSPSSPTTSTPVTVTGSISGCGAGNAGTPSLYDLIIGPNGYDNSNYLGSTTMLSNGGDTASATVSLGPSPRAPTRSSSTGAARHASRARTPSRRRPRQRWSSHPRARRACRRRLMRPGTRTGRSRWRGGLWPHVVRVHGDHDQLGWHQLRVLGVERGRCRQLPPRRCCQSRRRLRSPASR
jgi:hypothetical protein